MIMQYAVVVPVYNGAKYLESTLLSLFEQSHPAAEVIVVNDGSTDETGEILQGLATKYERLRVYSFANNVGVSRARNYGIEQAESPWCMLFDADDLADPELARTYSIEWQLARQTGAEPDMLFCATVLVDGDNRVISGENRFRSVMPDEMLGHLFVRNPIVSCSGVMIRRDAVLSLGGFDPELRYSEDWELWLRMAASRVIRYVDRVLCRIRRHPGNASASLNRMLNGERQVLSRYDLSVIREAVFRRNLPASRNWIDLANIAFRIDRWEEGRLFLDQVEEPSSSLDFHQGLYQLKMGRYAEAADWFRRAIDQDASNAAAANNYAGCLWRMGRKEEAVQRLQELTQKWPAYMDAAHNLNIMRSGDEKQDIKFTWRELRRVLTVYEEKE